MTRIDVPFAAVSDATTTAPEADSEEILTGMAGEPPVAAARASFASISATAAVSDMAMDLT